MLRRNSSTSSIAHGSLHAPTLRVVDSVVKRTLRDPLHATDAQKLAAVINALGALLPDETCSPRGATFTTGSTRPFE